MTRGEQIETWQGHCCWERKNGGGAKRCTVQCAHCRSTRSTEKAEGREFASTLSDNRVHFAVVDGCLEVTFDGHDTTWGEALSEGDTRELVAMLARVLLDGEMVSADWHGLTTILDTLYPADVFTGESGDPGARIVVLARKLAEVRQRAEKAEAAVRRLEARLAESDVEQETG